MTYGGEVSEGTSDGRTWPALLHTRHPGWTSRNIISDKLCSTSK